MLWRRISLVGTETSIRADFEIDLAKYGQVVEETLLKSAK